MTVEGLRAELEVERAWRDAEFRLLKNLTDYVPIERRDEFRKVLVVMLYSHFEGFCKVALTAYIRAVNEERLACEEANDNVAAAGLADVFAVLENTSAKSPFFRRSLPDDTQLHRFARYAEFVGRLREAFLRVVELSEDVVVDTESNLRPGVLAKLLYRVGLEHDAMKGFDGVVNELVNRRNGIAHGVERLGLSSDAFGRLERAVGDVMTGLSRMLTAALTTSKFRRSAS